ncbi:MAG: GGDEF domain-containing protein [Sphingomonadales bacterium]|nr:GGDEF domain-containing protein [Sphingomonadales bacterium]
MRIFGFGARKDGDEVQSAAGSESSAAGSAWQAPPGHEARAELLERISEFLLRNGLEVSARNLLIARAAFSGASLGLARKLTVAQSAGAISQEWLDAAVADDPDLNDSKHALDELRNTLDQSLSRFGDTARAASTATGEYGAALSDHASRIDGLGTGTVDMGELARLTQAMIARSQEMEAEMARSAKEAEGLRKKLAMAQRDADLDHLTGLPNRRAFETVFEREYREARASLDSLSIAICDIDKFKRINDTHGHETGDRVIQAIGEVLQQISNDRCHVARHGGEEFVLLFRGMTTEEARKQLDFARETFGNRHFVNRHTDEPIGYVTFSAGVANVFGYDDPRAALHAADDALYQAKEGGRNQVVIA